MSHIQNYLSAADKLFQTGTSTEHSYKLAIAKIEDEKLILLSENFKAFTDYILNFTSFVPQSIKSPLKLATLMAGKVRLLEQIEENDT